MFKHPPLVYLAGGTYPNTRLWYYGPYGTFGMYAPGTSNARASPVNVGPFATALVKGDPPARPYVDLRRPLYLCTPKKKSGLYPRPFLSTSSVCENLLSIRQRSVQRLGYIAMHKVHSGQPRAVRPVPQAKPQHFDLTLTLTTLPVYPDADPCKATARPLGMHADATCFDCAAALAQGNNWLRALRRCRNKSRNIHQYALGNACSHHAGLVQDVLLGYVR
jgi:hypothetical protein